MPERLSILEGDITHQRVDAIVNAANNSLLGGGGVDGAIHAAAGPRLLDECRRLNGCPTGSAKLTGGYLLPARWIIHTVGPIWRGGAHGEDELLGSCYRSSLDLAMKQGIRTLAFPSISTGAYGFPLDRAAAIAVREIVAYLGEHDLPSEVRMVCFDHRTREAYADALSKHRSGQ